MKKVMWDKSSTHFNFIKAENIVCTTTKELRYSVSFNFVKHWPIQNLFNNKIFPIYGISKQIMHSGGSIRTTSRKQEWKLLCDSDGGLFLSSLIPNQKLHSAAANS